MTTLKLDLSVKASIISSQCKWSRSILVTLNDAPLEYSVVNRATRTSQIIGMLLVETTSINSTLTIRNPAWNAAALTITPVAGGTNPVSSHLVITIIQ